MVVRAIDQNDLRSHLLKCFCGSQSAKSAADNDDSWLGHLLLNSLRSEILLLRAGAENNATGSRSEPQDPRSGACYPTHYGNEQVDGQFSNQMLHLSSPACW